MFQGPFPFVLRVSAVGWLLFVGLASAFMYMVSVEYGAPAWLWKTGLSAALGMGTLLLLASMLCKSAPLSVLLRIVFAGVMLVPILTLFGALGLSYLVATPEASRPWLWLLIALTTVLWCLKALTGYRQRVIERRFIEREFSIEETRIVVRQPFKTDLDPPPISEHTFFGKLYHRFGPYLMMAIPMGYPIQRLLSNTGGDSAVLLILALLGLPITIYMFGRMTCGAYLWIFKVWQLEKQHGKPVVFEVIPSR